MYAPSFLLGIIILWLGCGILTLLWGLLAVYCMVQWIHPSSPIKKETLEGFQRDPAVVTNVTASVITTKIDGIDGNHDYDYNNDDYDYDIKTKYTKKHVTLSARSLCWSDIRQRFFGGSSSSSSIDNNRNRHRNCNNVVRIRYVVPSPLSTSGINKNATAAAPIIVVKDIQSDFLYQKYCHTSPAATTGTVTVTAATTATTTTIPLHLDPDYPLSGYPTILLHHDISNSWSLCQWHIACFMTLLLYLVSACFAVDLIDETGEFVLLVYDSDSPPEDLMIAISIILSGPILLLPGASMLRQLEYDQFLLDLYEPKKIASII